MGTTLDHGIYLPDEGERNCYEGLAGNWVALDNHLGSTDIHVTINDKQAWNGHVADTTIHVTSADKQAWNGHVADLVKHVTAEDKNKWDAVTSKADDSDVVHNSGNETINGNKTFSSINGVEPSSLSLPNLSAGVDISGYLSVGASTNDSYTAPANGYIGVIYASSSACGCYVYNYTNGVFMRSNSITDSTYTNVCGCFIPILKNQTLNISTRATQSIVSAKFFPCPGNA